MDKLQSLHSHTTNSDGEYTHAELLEKAKQYNIGIIAFTDHDSVISPKQIEEIKNISDIQWISGIEISSGRPLELGGGSSSSLHIVGLFVDPENKELKEYCRLAQEARIERMNRMTKNLRNLGFKITEEDCIKQSGGEAVARPHIVKALLLYEENLKRMEEIKEDMRKASEKDENLREKYENLSKLSVEQYPYTLFLTEDSFINDVYVDYLYYLDFDKSVDLIRKAGGVAIIAHYFTCSNRVTPEILERYVQEKRIDGIETVFGLHSFGTPEEQRVVDSMKISKEIADKYNCMASGGVDIHRGEDIDLFAGNIEYANQTKGLLENMLEKFDLNTEYSNIK